LADKIIRGEVKNGSKVKIKNYKMVINKNPKKLDGKIKLIKKNKKRGKSIVPWRKTGKK
jgi:hypothetical protein